MKHRGAIRLDTPKGNPPPPPPSQKPFGDRKEEKKGGSPMKLDKKMFHKGLAERGDIREFKYDEIRFKKREDKDVEVVYVQCNPRGDEVDIEKAENLVEEEEALDIARNYHLNKADELAHKLTAIRERRLKSDASE